MTNYYDFRFFRYLLNFPFFTNFQPIQLRKVRRSIAGKILWFQDRLYAVIQHDCDEDDEHPLPQPTIIPHASAVRIHYVLEVVICLHYFHSKFQHIIHNLPNALTFVTTEMEAILSLNFEKDDSFIFTLHLRKSFSSSAFRKSFLRVITVRSEYRCIQ